MQGYNVLVSEANSKLGLQIMQELVSLPKPPSNIFATYQMENDLEDLMRIQDSCRSLKITLIKMDIGQESDIYETKSAIEQILGDQGIYFMVNIIRHKNDPENPSDCLRGCFETHVVSPLVLFKVMLPLLEAAVTYHSTICKPNIKPCFLNITEDNSDISLPLLEVRKVTFNLALAALIEEHEIEQVFACNIHLSTDEIKNEENLDLENYVRSLLLIPFCHQYSQTFIHC